MPVIDRKELMLEFIRSNGRFATVEQLCENLFVSGATVRRDLAELEAARLIRRTWGGAILLEGSASEDPLALRENQNVLAKQMIAGEACMHIRDGMTVFLDSSTTAYALARLLDRFSNLRVITNGLKTSWLLSNYRNIAVMCTGGTLRENTKSLVGQATLDYIAHLNADAAFMSCRGFGPENGASEASEDECAIKRLYISNSRHCYLLSDTTKLNEDYLCRIAPLERFTAVITENKDLNTSCSRP